MIGPDTFEYTRKSYWGAPSYSYWTLIFATIFGGLLGLDHIWLRSPTSGIAKLFVNILGFGVWWIYDIIQIIGEKENVMKYGLTAPLVGPLGIGAGMFVDDQPDVTPSSNSPLRWMLFFIASFLPFGFDSFVAGDTNGAIAKFFSAIFFLFWPIAIVWTMINIFSVVFTPKAVFESGSYRMFPFTFFMDKYGPNEIGTFDAEKEKDGSSGIMGFFKVVLPTIVGNVLRIVFPGVFPAAEAAAVATLGTVEKAAVVADGVLDTASQLKGPLQEVVEEAAKLPSVLASAQRGLESTIGSLGKYTTPEGLSAMAAEAAAAKVASQRGGAVLETFRDSGLESNALFIILIAILGGGTYFAFTRLNNGKSFQRDKKDDGRTRNDSPPQPS